MRYFDVCLPFYHPQRGDPQETPDALRRTTMNHDVALSFNGPHNEQGRMDFRQDLRGIRCPVLVLAGDQDPIMPMAFSETIAACLPEHLVRFERFPHCGHGVHIDDPEWAFFVLREFIAAET